MVWLPWILFSHPSWEISNHPNWRTHIFRGVAQPQPVIHFLDWDFPLLSFVIHIFWIIFWGYSCLWKPPSTLLYNFGELYMSWMSTKRYKKPLLSSFVGWCPFDEIQLSSETKSKPVLCVAAAFTKQCRLDVAISSCNPCPWQKQMLRAGKPVTLMVTNHAPRFSSTQSSDNAEYR